MTNSSVKGRFRSGSMPLKPTLPLIPGPTRATSVFGAAVDTTGAVGAPGSPKASQLCVSAFALRAQPSVSERRSLNARRR